MKITIKSKEELLKTVGDENTVIDEKTDLLFNEIADHIIEPNDFSVYRYLSGDAMKQKFSFEYFVPNSRFRNIIIPEEWVTDIDLEDNNDLYMCKSCYYKFKETQLYPFRDSKVVTVDDKNTDDVTDDEYDNKYHKTYKYMRENSLDTLCPICFKKNNFVQIKVD